MVDTDKSALDKSERLQYNIDVFDWVVPRVPWDKANAENAAHIAGRVLHIGNYRSGVIWILGWAVDGFLSVLSVLILRWLISHSRRLGC